MKKRLLVLAVFPPPLHGSSVVSLQIRNSPVIQGAFECDYVNIATSRALNESKNYLLKLGRMLVALSKTFGYLLTRHYDLCYCTITCHGGCFLRDAVYVLLCKIFGHKVVLHQHNKGMSLDVDKPVYKQLFPIVYRNTKVILLSPLLYPDVEKVVRKEDVLICPNGIKPLATTPVPRPHPPVPRILFLSNMLASKGVFVLLDALQLLRERGCRFACDFVGAETLELSATRFAEEVAQRGLTECAHYHGPQYGADKELFWQQSDIFAFPSVNETFSLVLLEAMQYGIPVVTTNVGGIPDIVTDGETGLIIREHQTSELADALEKLLTDADLRHRLGEAGRRKFEAQFTEARFEHTFVECLNTCL